MSVSPQYPPNGPLLAADEHDSVVAGRDALDQWWEDYPWYDGETDGIQRLELEPPEDSSWFWDWFGGWFEDWNWSAFSGIGDFFTMPTDWWGWVSRILIVLMVAGLIYALYRVGKYFRGQPPLEDEFAATDQKKKADTRSEADRVEALPFPVEPRGGDLLGAARHYRERQDYTRAIVYLFSHLLVQLDKQGGIRLTKGKTNRQYLRELGHQTPLWGLTEQTMVAFEDAFFGEHPLDRDRFEACWAHFGTLEISAGEKHP